MTARRLFVTGIDTGVGKTRVAGLLLAWLRRRGIAAVYFKPVESGAAAGGDAATVQALAGGEAPVVAGLRLPEPLAPALAAERAGVTVDWRRLDADVDALAARHACVVIEGAGGLLVEMSRGVTCLDAARRWRCALVIVVANRLGCLNHAALTFAAARAAAADVAGWVLNHTDGASSPARDTNAAELTRAHGPPLAVVPYAAYPEALEFALAVE